MPSQKAIITQGRRTAKVVSNAPIPSLRPGYVKVKTVAVALNPTDWKQIDMVGASGTLVGCDYSGIIEEIGPGVRKDLAIGDKIAGFAHGSNSNNHEDGTFAEHIIVKADICIKVPSNITMEQAATLGIGITTVGQALYKSFSLPLPTSTIEKPTPILIYGGNTATGTLAIQFAKLSGFEVITTSSPSNFARMKTLGASSVFDYNSPTVGKDIRAITNNHLAHVFDCQSDSGSSAICEQAIGEKGGKYVSLLYARLGRGDVSSVFTLAYTAFGEIFDLFGKKWVVDDEELAFSAKFWSLAGELLEEGKIKTHPVEVKDGGLEGILNGLEDMRQGKVRGKKLVYRI